MAAIIRCVKRVQFLPFISQVWLQGRRKIVENKHNKLVQAMIRIRHSWRLVLTTPTLALGLFGQSSSSEETATKQLSDEELAIVESDKLFDDYKIDELYELLMKFCESRNAEIVWRLARAARNKAQLCESLEDKKIFTYKAYDFAKKSVELDDRNFACHKWLGITMSKVGDIEGYKVEIQNAYKIQEHFQKSIELNPNDPTCKYLLGVWCFTIADLLWYKQKAAAFIFATPPSSSFQEALDHFEMAEALEADFFSKNHLMLGKTNLRLKKYEEAKVWLNKAANCTGITGDDEEAKKEAMELLLTL